MRIVGDTGYYSAKELEKCDKDNIEVVVAVPNKEKQQKDRGFYLHSDFTYDEKDDCYICPNQQILTKKKSVIIKENGTKSFVYRVGSKICKSCPLKDNCISYNYHIFVFSNLFCFHCHLVKFITIIIL